MPSRLPRSLTRGSYPGAPPIFVLSFLNWKFYYGNQETAERIDKQNRGLQGCNSSQQPEIDPGAEVDCRERADAAREEEVSRTIDSTQADGITIAPESCTLLASSMSAMFGASTFTASSSAIKNPTDEHLHADHA